MMARITSLMVPMAGREEMKQSGMAVSLTMRQKSITPDALGLRRESAIGSAKKGAAMAVAMLSCSSESCRSCAISILTAREMWFLEEKVRLYCRTHLFVT